VYLVTDCSKGKEKGKAVVHSSRFYISKKKILDEEHITLSLNVKNNVRSDAEKWRVASIMILVLKLLINLKYYLN
jgi:hypothetical protein